jgi:hypothetical protein
VNRRLVPRPPSAEIRKREAVQTSVNRRRHRGLDQFDGRLCILVQVIGDKRCSERNDHRLDNRPLAWIAVEPFQFR